MVSTAQTFFGIISGDRLYFKTDEAARARYKEAGMDFFKPSDIQHLKNYYEVPPDAVEDIIELTRFVKEAIAVKRKN